MLPPILLIDDDAISREVMQMTLEMHGATVTTAEDGAEALRVLSDGYAPGLVLMDTQMPGLSGVTLIEALRLVTKGRIVAISASEPGPAIHAVADGFLLKPIQPETVLALLKNKTAQPAASVQQVIQLAAKDASPIDQIVLDKLTAMMPVSAVREIYAATATDLATRIVTLEAAMLSGDTTEVVRNAHAIKGGCAMVGLTAARDAAARLESSNLQGTWFDELARLRITLCALQGMLGGDFPP